MSTGSTSSQSIGSSPLTRGKRPARHHQAHHDRLIPAHAGKTNAKPPTVGHCKAHPRSRGENLRPWSARIAAAGSSPLTRGKRRAGRVARSPSRLIPAHAGKTLVLLSTSLRTAAHPRSRGENTDPSACADGPPGSSPLTRGKHRSPEHRGQAPGLIPAHAGKTSPGRGQPQLYAAHPRSRGENFTRPRPASVVCGSSPLTRGKRGRHRVCRPDAGLIPAHAGKTLVLLSTSLRTAAHPRSRGENASWGCPAG